MPVGDGWDPPEEAYPWSDFHWWKVAPGRVLELVILSERPLWYTGHFVQGRMRPCYGDDCAECRKGTGGQVRYVMATAEVSTKRVGIFEVGRAVGLQIRDLAVGNSGVRGVWFEFGKESPAKQSRMTVQMINKSPGNWWHSLPVPDLKKALAATWDKARIALPTGFQHGPKWKPSVEGR